MPAFFNPVKRRTEGEALALAMVKGKGMPVEYTDAAIVAATGWSYPELYATDSADVHRHILYLQVKNAIDNKGKLEFGPNDE